MQYEGSNPIYGVPELQVRVTLEGEVTIADPRLSIGPGVLAFQLEDGVEVTDFVLDESVIAYGGDLMAGGRQYGNRIYFFNALGFLMKPNVVARCKVLKHPEKKSTKAA